MEWLECKGDASRSMTAILPAASHIERPHVFTIRISVLSCVCLHSRFCEIGRKVVILLYSVLWQVLESRGFEVGIDKIVQATDTVSCFLSMVIDICARRYVWVKLACSWSENSFQVEVFHHGQGRSSIIRLYLRSLRHLGFACCATRFSGVANGRKKKNPGWNM